MRFQECINFRKKTGVPLIQPHFYSNPNTGFRGSPVFQTPSWLLCVFIWLQFAVLPIDVTKSHTTKCYLCGQYFQSIICFFLPNFEFMHWILLFNDTNEILKEVICTSVAAKSGQQRHAVLTSSSWPQTALWPFIVLSGSRFASAASNTMNKISFPVSFLSNTGHALRMSVG